MACCDSPSLKQAGIRKFLDQSDDGMLLLILKPLTDPSWLRIIEALASSERRASDPDLA